MIIIQLDKAAERDCFNKKKQPIDTQKSNNLDKIGR